MIGIVDADILVYRCGFAAEKRRKITTDDGSIEHARDVEPLANALHNVDTVVGKILESNDFGRLEFYLTGSGNFRQDIATILPYKGNRSPLAKPFWYKEIKEYILDKYKATLVNGMEADDAIGIRQTADENEPTTIITIDKDLDMIPGPHYNPVKDIKYDVSERDGYRSFYRQVLTGDRTDNIPGLDGIGPKRASAIIDQYSSERAMWQAARYHWHKECPDGLGGKATDAVVNEVAALLWIGRTGRERWSEPTS